MKLDDKIEPLFVKHEIEKEIIAVSYEFAPPEHIRTNSTRNLYDWPLREIRSKVLSRYMEKTSCPELRGEGL